MKERIAYFDWGKEYLREADALRKRLGNLRAVPVKKRDEQMIRRISMLNEMYVECRHIGRLLQERGKCA